MPQLFTPGPPQNIPQVPLVPANNNATQVMAQLLQARQANKQLGQQKFLAQVQNQIKQQELAQQSTQTQAQQQIERDKLAASKEANQHDILGKVYAQALANGYEPGEIESSILPAVRNQLGMQSGNALSGAGPVGQTDATKAAHEIASGSSIQDVIKNHPNMTPRQIKALTPLVNDIRQGDLTSAQIDSLKQKTAFEQALQGPELDLKNAEVARSKSEAAKSAAEMPGVVEKNSPDALMADRKLRQAKIDEATQSIEHSKATIANMSDEASHRAAVEDLNKKELQLRTDELQLKKDATIRPEHVSLIQQTIDSGKTPDLSGVSPMELQHLLPLIHAAQSINLNTPTTKASNEAFDVIKNYKVKGEGSKIDYPQLTSAYQQAQSAGYQPTNAEKADLALQGTKFRGQLMDKLNKFSPASPSSDYWNYSEGSGQPQHIADFSNSVGQASDLLNNAKLLNDPQLLNTVSNLTTQRLLQSINPPNAGDLDQQTMDRFTQLLGAVQALKTNLGMAPPQADIVTGNDMGTPYQSLNGYKY